MAENVSNAAVETSTTNDAVIVETSGTGDAPGTVEQSSTAVAQTPNVRIKEEAILESVKQLAEKNDPNADLLAVMQQLDAEDGEGDDAPQFEYDSDEVISDFADELEFGMPQFEAGGVLQAVDPKKMSAVFTIVTRGAKPNRHGAMVHIAENERGKGLMLDNFNRNPVVMFGHGNTHLSFGGVVGTAMDKSGNVRLVKGKRRAVSEAFFSQVHPDVALLFGMIDEKIFRAASIQFLPTLGLRLREKPKDLAEDEVEFDFRGWPFDFVEEDLMEWSVVNIPADPNAVRKCLDRGSLNDQKVTPTMRRVLQSMVGKKNATVSGYSFSSSNGSGILISGNSMSSGNGFNLKEPVAQEGDNGPYVFEEQQGDYSSRVTFATAEELTEHVAKIRQLQSLDVDKNSCSTPETTAGDAVEQSKASEPVEVASVSQMVADEVKSQFGALVQPVVDRSKQLDDNLKRLTGKVD